jgi:hypothetical protein
MISAKLSFWEVTDTVYADRKNIFALGVEVPYHVGTIISGSRSKLARFETDVGFIRTAPAMRAVLGSAANLLCDERIRGDVDLIELRSVIQALLRGNER